MSDALLAVGALAAAIAAAGSLLVTEARARAGLMVGALGLAAVLIAVDNWDDPRFVDLRDDGAVFVVGVVVAGLGVVALAAVLRRWLFALPLLAVAALPFRIPIEAGGASANLLVPLYVVIASVVLAEAVSALRSGPERGREGEAQPVRILTWVLAATLVLYTAQATYAHDLSRALEDLCFFYVPFAVLFALLLRVTWSSRLLTGVLVVAVAEAMLFGLVGFVEFATRELLWNPDVIAANDFHPYFRVNSLFWDPNILARYLAVTASATAAAMLWTRSARLALAAATGCLVMLATTAITFSQSGLVALLAGLVVLAALRWSARRAIAVGAVVAVGAAALLLTGGDDPNGQGLDEQISGRGSLIEGGLELAEDRPIAGWGSGSFSRRFKQRFGPGSEDEATISHTEPVTIAAEQGALGLIVYLALLVSAFAALLAGLGPLAPGLRGLRLGTGRDPPGSERTRTVLAIARVAALAGFTVMVVHSISYAAFLTDPITWVLLAVGAALTRGIPDG